MPDIPLTNQFYSQNQYLQNLMDTYSANNTKIDYAVVNNDGMVYINSYLFLLYMLVAIIFSVILFISPKWKELQIYKKTIITVILLILPFCILRLETYAYSILIYFRDMLYGNTYLRHDY